MASPTNPVPLPAEIRVVLASLRRRIRFYVVLEGLAVAAIWIGLTFWAALALDYLPILVGSSELPQWARAAILVVIGGVLAFILYRWVLSRLFASLQDRSLALLLERRFGQFHDSLVTVVELSQSPQHADEFSSEMLTFTNTEALTQVGRVRLGEVFNLRPLVLKLAAVAGLVLSLVGFYAISPASFQLATNRIWLVGEEAWPRRARIEVLGIEVQRAQQLASAADAPPSLVEFVEGSIKVARGANLNLRVVADASATVIPDVCTFTYRQQDGQRGRVAMKRIGRVRREKIGGVDKEVQTYAFDGKPLKGIVTSLDFSVIGHDHRVGSYRINVVDSPALVETELACEFPAYMVDEATSSWLPRSINYLPAGTQLPRGTKFTVKARANKELQKVTIRNAETNVSTIVEVQGKGDAAQKFEFPVESLSGNLLLEVTLHDRDNVLSESPQRIAVTAIPDEAPRVDIRLKGISTVVTPDVVVPAQGKIEDDYGVSRGWIDLQLNDQSPRQEPVAMTKAGAVETEVDFRKLRSEEGGLELKPKDKLTLRVEAEDRFKLKDAGPNVGSGDHYELEVVTSDELLRLLESRELALRRRFEQAIEEVTLLRDSLVRVKLEANSPGSEERNKAGAEPDDRRPATSGGENPGGKGSSEVSGASGTEPGEESSDNRSPEERIRSLRSLLVTQAIQQSMKNSQEVLGISASFAEIREELINNRVDTEDRKSRLQEQIADPLRQIAQVDFAELDRRLAVLEKALDDAQQRGELSEAAIQQAERVLAEMNEVLQNMLDLETFNELLDIVRDLLKEQGELIDKTKQQKKKQLLDLTK